MTNRTKGHCYICGRPIGNRREAVRTAVWRSLGRTRRYGTKRQRSAQDGW